MPNTPHRRWGLVPVAAAAVLVIALGWSLIALTSIRDRTVEIETVPADRTGTVVGIPGAWPTATPSAELLPAGSLDPPAFVFGPSDTAGGVADAYLAARLDDFGPDLLTVAEQEVVDGHALFRWELSSNDVAVGGWLFLRQDDGGRWWVVASTTETVDMHRVVGESARVDGLITSAMNEILAADLIDLETDMPFHPATGEALAPDELGRRYGTLAVNEGAPPGAENRLEIAAAVAAPGSHYAIRVQAIGGTFLTISEAVVPTVLQEIELAVFVDPSRLDEVQVAIEAEPSLAAMWVLPAANTRADYHGRYREVPEVAAIWDDAADIRSIVLALATDGVEAQAVAQRLAPIDGVLAIVPVAPVVEPSEPRRAGDLIAESRAVAYRPEPITCEVQLGEFVPLNRVRAVDDPRGAESASEALGLFLAEASFATERPAGWIELVEADGTISYGHATEPEHFVVVVRTEQDDRARWAVTGWEATPC